MQELAVHCGRGDIDSGGAGWPACVVAAIAGADSPITATVATASVVVTIADRGLFI